MTMRLIDADALDAAFTALRFNADGSLKHWGDRPDWCLHGNEIETLIKDAPTVEPKREWISVKDRLPEDNRFVLVCNDDGHMMVAQYIGEGTIWEWQYKYTNYDVDVWDNQEQGPVCWWMRLPEPPKEDDDEP
jgi:hypothetical protein